MSQVIDTKVVEMQFDNSKFEKNIEVSLNSLKFLNKNIEDAGKNRGSLDELAHASDQVGISFDNMNMKSRISLNLFDMLAGVGTKAFNRISDAVAGFALNMANSLSGMQAMRDGFNEYELKMGSVQTILAGAKIIDPNTGQELKNEAERLAVVNQRLEDLNKYSDRTIYSFKDMTSNIGKFTNAGVNLDDAVDAIQGVANVAAISGANAGEASRAMYNFAQALSSGYVKLIDWKSIENANMATVGFKEELLKTALAVGTVRKEGDKYVTTTTDANGKVSEAFDATMMFNDSLSHQWMTTEVLTTTLKKYTDESTELGKKAFAAATEVKTFSQMMDTLKESLGSGWAQSFEIIFGDFIEAKKLWTGLNNTIDGIISPIGKARNMILQTWKDNGGRDALIKSFSNLKDAVSNLLAPLKKLWKALTPNTDHSGKILATISKWIEKLTGLVAKGAEVVGKAIGFVLKPAVALGNRVGKGLVKLVGIVRDAFSKIVNFFSPVKKAITTFSNTISTAFNKQIASRIKNFQLSISNAFNSLKKYIQNSQSLKKVVNAFKELKANIQELFEKVLKNAGNYAKKFASYIGKLWNAIAPLVSSVVVNAFRSLADIVLPKLRVAIDWVADRLRAFGKVLNSIDFKNSKLYKGLAELPDRIKALTGNKNFKKVFSTIKGFGSEAIQYLSGKFKELKSNMEAIKMPRGLADAFEKIKGFIKSIFGKNSVNDDLSKTLNEAAASTEEIANAESGQKLTAFQKFLEGISNAFEWLKNAAETAKDAVVDFVNFVRRNIPKAIKGIHDFIAGDDGIIQLSDISEFLYTISDAFSTFLTAYGFEQISVSFKGISDAMGDLSEAVVVLAKRAGNKMNMSAIRDFAIAVGILAGAIWVFSKIPADKLAIAGGAVLLLGFALSKFFGVISSGTAKLTETAGFIPIAVLLLAIGAGMIAVAASVGILVGVLAVFPRVIKQYNNLGAGFREGMDRVREVLAEIFEYLDHAAGSKYSFRSAMALLGLVFALGQLRKIIEKYANKSMADAMEVGLDRIKQVLEALGGFLASIQIGSFSFINIGIDLDTVGMALMILAIGRMIEKITPMIETLSKLTPQEYKTAFKSLEKVLTYLAEFLVIGALVSGITGTGLTTWLGIGATVAILASAIGSCVKSIETLANLATTNPEGLKTALEALGGIFVALGVVLMIIGDLKVEVKGLFGLSLAIGVLTFCVMALVPIAKSHPEEMIAAVISLGVLMAALGGTMLMIKSASSSVTIKDVLMLLGVTVALTLLAQQIRRIAMIGGDAASIISAGAAIGIAAMSIAAAMKVLATVPMINPLVLGGLALLALAIWGVAYAIMAFKSSSGQMAEGSAQVTKGIEDMGSGANEALANLGESLDLSGLLDKFGAQIGEKIRNFNLGEAIHGMVQSVAASAVNWAQDFIDIGTNLIDGISTAISNPANVEKVKGTIVALGKALLESFCLFFGIHSPSTVMAEQGGFVIDGLVQGLMDFPSKLSGWISGLGNTILTAIGGLFSGALEKGRELVQTIGDGIQNGKELVVTKASEIGQAALDKLSDAKQWAAGALSSAEAFAENLRQSKNPIAKAAGNMIAGATSSIRTMAKIFSSSATSARSAFVSAIRSGVGPAKAAAKAIVAGAKSAFSGIANAFKEYGKNAAEGFRNGIHNMISSIAQKAAEMVRKAKNAAKREQNSNSPSKDFMEYGGWAAEGYALGMVNRKSTHLIEANAQKMVGFAKDAASGTSIGIDPLQLESNSAISSLAYAMSQISDAVDGDFESSPMIRPVVDMRNIDQSALAMASLFGDKSLDASINATRHVQNDFDRVMAKRLDSSSAVSISKLANKLDSMTSAMNSRSLNNYINIDGSTDPEAFADGLIRSFRLNARTV